MELDCEFNMYESKYSTSVRGILFNSCKLFDSSGTHLAGKTNEDVEHLQLCHVRIKMFPLGIGKIFPNLKRLWINYAEIDKICREDFKGLENVTTLTLIGNKIVQLDEDLFHDLPNLIVLNLSNNFIRKIHPKTFDQLKKLDTLCLCNNLNIHSWWTDLSRSENHRNKAMEKIARKCPYYYQFQS